MAFSRRDRRNLLLGIGFLTPNILGFLVFALVPLGFSLVMAFTNWDLKLHNMFKDEPIRFIGVENFVRLFTQDNFWRFLGNTLFFMMSIPFSVAGSLILAILLTRDLRGPNKTVFAYLLGGAVLVACVVLLAVLGAGASAMTVVLVGMGAGILVFGVLGSTTFYRTMFYLPHFCAGVATFILWKKLYSPIDGPINMALAGPLMGFSDIVNNTPGLMVQGGMVACFALMGLIVWFAARRLFNMWGDGELGTNAAVMPVILLALPALLALRWTPPHAELEIAVSTNPFAWILAIGVVGWLGFQVARAMRGRDYHCSPSNGVGNGLMFALAMMVLEFVLLGFGIVFFNLPGMAADGLEPPQWIADYHWAKPALMLMALWGAIGSNNMLLYIAGLSNVPQDLYEAADIDGASPFQRFWNVTWPQLAPTTFFIAVMATIHGLRGGFEIARTMTMGGPAGATTFLSYFIFTEGFETGRLGYSSAVAWSLFAMTFALTIFNWKFGNKYVND